MKMETLAQIKKANLRNHRAEPGCVHRSGSANFGRAGNGVFGISNGGKGAGGVCAAGAFLPDGAGDYRPDGGCARQKRRSHDCAHGRTGRDSPARLSLCRQDHRRGARLRAQRAAGLLYGAAIGLVNSDVMRELDGTVRLMAVPAEEGINISGREALI